MTCETCGYELDLHEKDTEIAVLEEKLKDFKKRKKIFGYKRGKHKRASKK